jgi:hypothetical protein
VTLQTECTACKQKFIYSRDTAKRQIVRDKKGMTAVWYAECPACHSNVILHEIATKPGESTSFEAEVAAQKSTTT